MNTFFVVFLMCLVEVIYSQTPADCEAAKTAVHNCIDQEVPGLRDIKDTCMRNFAQTYCPNQAATGIPLSSDPHEIKRAFKDACKDEARQSGVDRNELRAAKDQCKLQADALVQNSGFSSLRELKNQCSSTTGVDVRAACSGQRGGRDGGRGGRRGGGRGRARGDRRGRGPFGISGNNQQG